MKQSVAFSFSLALSLLLHAALLLTFSNSKLLLSHVSSQGAVSVTLVTAEPPKSTKGEKTPKQAQTTSAPGVADSVTLQGELAPEYPWKSRMLKEEGTVDLKAFVTSEGTVERIEIVKSSGFSRLDEAAIASLSKSTFLNESGQSSVVVLTLNFKLREKP